MSETAWTPGPWRAFAKPVSSGLRDTGIAHCIEKGGQEYTVAITSHQNYDHIHTEPLGKGYTRRTGIGARPLDLAPHPDARLIAAAPELYEALILVTGALIEHAPSEQRAIQQALHAIAKAEGRS